MRKIWLFMLAVLALVGCSDEDPSQIVVDPGFSAYVSAYTTGVISCQSNIRIILVAPHPDAVAGEAISKELFDFEPSIEGTTYWLDNQTIEFRPAKNLPSGQAYVVKFQLKELIEVPEEFEEMKFGFVVIRQNMFVTFDGVRTLDMNDFSKQDLFGTVRTSDNANPADLQKCLTATQSGKKLDIAWEHPEGSKSHTFTVKGSVRTDQRGSVDLKWDGSPIGAKVEGEEEIIIPSLKEFVVMQVRTVQSPGLYFSVQFSDPVDPNQDLTGLIYLRSESKLRFSINKNEVKAYPLDKLNSEETIVVDQSIVNIRGKKLTEPFEKVVQFNLANPAIELIGDGVIMPTVGKTSFPFKAINLKAVNVRVLKVYENNVNQFFQVNQIDGNSELARVGRLVYDGVIDLVSDEGLDYGVWNSFNIDLSNIIDPAPGSIYRVMISFEKNQSLYPCGDTVADVKPMKRRELNFDQDSYFDEDMWFDGDYDYESVEDPCSDSYYQYYGRSKSANIFSSNIGIIAKESADNTYTVVTTDLRTTDPISGVDIEAYNFQNILIGSGETNGDGVAQFQTKGVPYLIVAKEGAQRGYLRVDKGSALSVSLYDVGGAKVDKGVKGFIYGERGVWRPGDSLFLSFMLEDKLDALPETHPIIMELYDPLGKLYDKKVKTKGVHGLYGFTFVTGKDSPTGKWQAKAVVGNSSFTTSLKIETVKPNRLAIDFDFGKQINSSQTIASTLTAKWMYGAPGANLKTTVEMNVSPIKTAFDKYENFMFDDMTVDYTASESIICEAKTDASGKARIAFNWDGPESAPGMLKLSFNTKVYEQGGDYSQDFLSKKYSPFSSYVGIKMDKGTNWLTAFDTEKESAVSIAAVDEYGRPVNRKVTVELYKMEWNWWWESDGEEEVTQYVNRESITLLKSESFNVSNGRNSYALSFPEPDWGRYLLRVVDEESGHSASQMFFGEYSGWYNNNSGGDNNAATALSIETGKEEYKVGEKIAVTVPSGGLGNIYVTVEKGDKILQQMWVKATDNSTTFNIDATADMAPNVYVSAVLIQPHGQDKNSLPIRMYGVVPVKVIDPQTKLLPVLTCPATVQPEKVMKVNVSEKSGKAMAYTLAVVDEGLLSLTRYKTPDPWPNFYSKEALSVRSWDMYKYVMSALTGKMVPLLAVGGDEGLNYKDDANANRFKPVVSYLGPFYLEAGKTASHNVRIPNYIGAVRVMVVAGIDGAYGCAEKEVQVKQPLMVLTTLPRVLGPSERLRIPVNVITMDDKIKTVQVQLKSSYLLKATGTTTQTVTFAKSGEKTVYFDYEVARGLGVAKLKVELTSGAEKAYEDLEIIVRPPNPLITTADAKALNAKETWSKEYTAIGVNGSNKASLQISSIPDLNLEKHLQYLIQYPHGCIEQTTSSVFPQLYLDALVQLTDAQKSTIKANVIAGLARLKTFQTATGGLSYWPGSEYPSDWGTNYAGHFILEAKALGYELPVGLLDGWLKFQKNKASNWTRASNEYYGYNSDDLTQAYRLYTLALAGESDMSAMNRLRADANLSDMGAWRLAAAYAIAGRDDAAKALATRSRNVKQYREMSYSFGSDVRDQAMVLETMFYLNDRTNGLAIITDIATKLSQGWYSTQTRAYSLMAIAKYVGRSDNGTRFSANVVVNGKAVKVDSQSPVWSMDIPANQLAKGSVQVTNNSSQLIFASLVQSGIPVEANDVPADKDLTMQIRYEDLKGNPVNVQSLRQGQDFKAIVTVIHTGVREDYKEMALNQVFPSGWQIVNTRVGDGESSAASAFTYQDLRDDRVYTYFDLRRGERKQFEILLNATFAGKYYMPAIFCAPMYDESVQALKPGQWVEVTASQQ